MGRGTWWNGCVLITHVPMPPMQGSAAQALLKLLAQMHAELGITSDLNKHLRTSGPQDLPY
jgi:hypothetical protein